MKPTSLSYYLDIIKSASDRQDWDKAKHYGEIALKKLSNLSYSPFEKHLLYVRLGYNYKQLALYTNSLDTFYKAYFTASKHHLGKSYLAYCSYMMGVNFLSLDSPTQALSQFQKVERYFQKYGDQIFPMETTELYINSIKLGFCYLSKNELNKVREILDEKLPSRLTLSSKKYSFRDYYYLKSEYLLTQKKYDQARQSFEEYIKINEINKTINYEEAIIKGKIRLAMIDLLERQLESAINILESLFTKSYDLKLNSSICEIGLLLSKCYTLKKLPEKSVSIEKRIKPFLKKLDIMWLYKKTNLFERLYHHLQTIYQSPSPSTATLLIDTINRHYERVNGKYIIIGQSPAMIEVYQVIEKIAATDLPVLIQGETGTGKELIARAIHHYSLRKEKEWLALNCGNIPESLIGNELFGHNKGAFTDAREDKKGYIELASEGTLFLDEIAEMSPAMQQKLLRVMDEKVVWRLGSEKPIPINTRFIFASNQNVEALLKGKRFRKDLFYRINTIVITLPPLRDRKEDIPLLVNHFLKKYSPLETFRGVYPASSGARGDQPAKAGHSDPDEYRGKNLVEMTPSVLNLLVNYPWPGNVRELENEIERICILYPDVKQITEAMLSESIRNYIPVDKFLPTKSKLTMKELTDNFQRKIMGESIKNNNGNMTKTAQELGYTRRGLYKKIKQLNITTD